MDTELQVSVPFGGAHLNSPADQMAAPHIDKDGSLGNADEGERGWQEALHQMIYNSIRYVDGELSPKRAEAEAYYKGEPLGNEKDGRSKVVMTELRDVILMIMPSLMRLFFSPIPACEFVPENAQPETIKKAEQLTQFIMDIVLTQDNQGYLVISDWFKDALIKNLGILKVWQDDSHEMRTFSASYMSIEQLTLLAQDPSIEVENVAPTPDSPPGLYDAEYTQHKQWSRTRIVCVPPEEYLFTKGARTGANDPAVPGVADFVGHRTELKRGQLRALGVSEEDIEQWAFRDTSLEHNIENIERQDHKVTDVDVTALEANKRALYIEGYPFLDLEDGNGLRLCKVVTLGPQYHIIEGPTPCSRRPFAVITPDPTPHHIIGTGPSDWTMDLQLITSMLWRAVMDSAVLAVNPRYAYVDNSVSLADLQNLELAAPIRMRQQGDLQELTHTFVGQQMLPVLAALSEVKENRVGVTKASAGLDASALQSSSAAAVSAAVTNAQAHIEMIARCFAETGFRDLMRMCLELMVENQNGPRIAKVMGEYVAMDPRTWDASLDVRANIAIGGGTAQERIQVLQDVVTRIETIFQTMGPQNPIAGPKEYRDAIVKMLKERGRADATMFLKDVDPNWQPPQPDPSKGDPNMIIAQAESTKAAAEAASKQHDAELNVQKHEVDVARRAEDLNLKAQQMQMDDDFRREQLRTETALRIAEINAQFKAKVTIEEINATVAREQLASDERRRAHSLKITHNPTTGEQSLHVTEEGQ